MTDQKARLHQWFHLFLVNFALWAFGAFAILYGIRSIYEAKMDGYSGSEFMMIVIVNILLIATGLFTIKTRFDLADFHLIALKELPGVCIRFFREAFCTSSSISEFVKGVAAIASPPVDTIEPDIDQGAVD